MHTAAPTSIVRTCAYSSNGKALHSVRAELDKENPTQVEMITTDQPVYALGKHVQWLYPDEFGDVFRMLGPLHIEMLILNSLGNWPEDSGWCDVYKRSGITTSGKVDNFLKGAKVKRSRYAHQVTLAALQTLAKQAYVSSGSGSYEDWNSSTTAFQQMSCNLFFSCLFAV